MKDKVQRQVKNLKESLILYMLLKPGQTLHRSEVNDNKVRDRQAKEMSNQTNKYTE